MRVYKGITRKQVAHILKNECLARVPTFMGEIEQNYIVKRRNKYIMIITTYENRFIITTSDVNDVKKYFKNYEEK